MKYVRKITVIVIVLAFLVALSVGLGYIYSLRNVNISLLTYYELSENAEGEEVADIKESKDYQTYKSDYDKLSAALSRFKGTLVAFIGEDDIEGAVRSSGYTLAEYERVMPCTINVTLKQRVETFGVEVEDGYAVYDEDGEFLHVSENLDNGLDGTPNVLLTSASGELSQATISHIADICSVFRKEFSAFRYIVDSVGYSVEPAQQYHIDVLTFNMRLGVVIEIGNFSELLPEKIKAAHDVYNRLSAEDKLKGVITVTNSGENIRPNYKPER